MKNILTFVTITALSIFVTAYSFVQDKQLANSLNSDADLKKKIKTTTEPLTQKNINSPTVKYLKYFYDKINTAEFEYNSQQELTKNLKGSVTIATYLSDDGTIIRITVSQSSGHKELDEAAIKLIKLAAPFYKIPKAVMENKDQLVILKYFKFNTDN